MNEVVYVYSLSELPRALREPVPLGSPIEPCAFYVAAGGSPAVGAAFAAVPEPAAPHVQEGLAVAAAVTRALRVGRALDALGVSITKHAFGFHAGDRAAVEAALRAAGAEVRPITALLARIAVVTIDSPHSVLGPHDLVVERWARAGTIRFQLLTPVEPTAARVVPVPDEPLVAWTILDGSGRRAAATALAAGGAHTLALSRARATVSGAETGHAAQHAARILADAYLTPVVFEPLGLESTVEVGPVVGSLVTLTVTQRQNGQVVSRQRDDVPLLSTVTPFDDARYRDFVRGVRAAIDPSFPPRPADVLPLVLFDDATLDSEAAFATQAASPEAWACSAARHHLVQWTALGLAHHEPLVLGLLSPAWARDASRFRLGEDDILATQRNALALVPGDAVAALAEGTASLWARWLLGDAVDAATGMLGERVLSALWDVIGMERVTALVDAEIERRGSLPTA